MKSVFNHLLGFLCVADLLFIIPNIILSVLIVLGIYKSNLYPVCECISHFGLASSTFTIIAITFERHQVHYSHIKNNSSIPIFLGCVFAILLPKKACYSRSSKAAHSIYSSITGFGISFQYSKVLIIFTNTYTKSNSRFLSMTTYGEILQEFPSYLQ